MKNENTHSVDYSIFRTKEVLEEIAQSPFLGAFLGACRRFALSWERMVFAVSQRMSQSGAAFGREKKTSFLIANQKTSSFQRLNGTQVKAFSVVRHLTVSMARAFSVNRFVKTCAGETVNLFGCKSDSGLSSHSAFLPKENCNSSTVARSLWLLVFQSGDVVTNRKHLVSGRGK